MSEPKNVAFLGLGVMGYPMAGHLARAGHQALIGAEIDEEFADEPVQRRQAADGG